MARFNRVTNVLQMVFQQIKVTTLRECTGFKVMVLRGFKVMVLREFKLEVLIKTAMQYNCSSTTFRIRLTMMYTMVKSMVGGSMAEYQATGPVYLLGGVFPNYRPLITNNQPVVQSIPLNAPSAQPTALVSAPAPAPPPSAPSQVINPRLLVREQPQHTGQNVNRLTQDQVACMFLHPQHTIDPTQQQLIQQTPPKQQVVQPMHQTPPIQQVVQPAQQTPPRQQVLQPIQQTPLRQQVVQPIQQQGSMNASAGFATPGGQPVQHAANQVVPEHLVHHVQLDGTVIPHVILEHLLRNIQPDLQNYQGAI
ncbi:uncharacterized protein LOC127768871 [Oryza glaberrima]|uniref:uncharacterized protein LOC127768871 n=1 Tax=Oryza glaberrima TaxID=4538 RepID=UPI00224BF937|nr:uncharacterized protein LOC127768871 [Oryza glaberrima]XP_052150487.1 uncharacterized protein LOC127768871 [Oryza glaberrima]XP_052150488.1 uncharacterized protein LOC127768871 [Oryza glaberrima]XP_052150489.1 uncharacterized protein LOC127768871 [Oryza glaberrima]XP_052150490.1 uncharacterized protein LOC127768871 [Oryza glaberrima]XP_052150491.1 uncharacterized protein LOC127768871 [Oryza glaberrima]XP_052150492.1 uncharacterized protein LOC127768871 [Oryza glaberrima]XP_052150493.1 unc